MHKIRKHSIVFLLVAGLLFIPCGTSALAQDLYGGLDDGVEKMLADFILVRPLGIIATAVGTIMFGLSYPFSALGGNVDEAYQKMMVEPARFTFKRPLGKF
ncbi:MAG: hypothetical protein V3W43_05050 [Desulfatiglandaceae bacterium]|jgi:hypothetical protein